MALTDYNRNPDLNTTISGVDIAEGCNPAGVNNATRQIMADVAVFNEDDFSRTIVVPTGETGLTVPPIVNRASKVLLFDSLGDAGASAFGTIYAGTEAVVADNRTILGNMSGVAVNQAVMLMEPGREGLFKYATKAAFPAWSSDTREGLYVASTVDLTKVWVRCFIGPASPTWWGLLQGNNPANGATNDAVMTGMFTALKARAPITISTYYIGVDRVLFPPGDFWFASTIEPNCTVIMEGADTGNHFARATRLRFPVGVTGIRTQRTDTSGLSTGPVTAHSAADGSLIRYLSLLGGYATSGVNAEAHGIQMRSRTLIEFVQIEGFEGDGIFGSANVGASSYRGDVSKSLVNQCRIVGCRNGLRFIGGDANVILVSGADIVSCRQWGVDDDGFLGNTYIACHTASNVSGPFRTTNASAQAVFLGCYSEADQPTSVFSPNTIISGGLHAAGVSGGARTRGSLNTFRVNALVVDGDVTFGADDDPTAKLINIRSGTSVRINNAGDIKKWSFSVTSTGQLLFTTSDGGDFKVGGKLQADFEVNINSGVMKIDGTQVVKGRQAAVGHSLTTAAASPTMAEYNDLVNRFNSLVDRLGATTGHGLTGD